MKTIHVNITSKKKKNVYFYDFWVITLLFANKIFNDNLLGFGESCFVLRSFLKLRCLLFMPYLLVAVGPVTASRRLPSCELTSALRRADGEWRGQSLVTLPDGLYMNIRVIKKFCRGETADCGEIWQLPKSITPLTHLSAASSPGGCKTKEKHGWRMKRPELNFGGCGLLVWVTFGNIRVLKTNTFLSLCSLEPNCSC